MGSLASVLGTATGMDPKALLKAAGGIGTVGQDVANIGNSASGIIPGGTAAMPMAAPTVGANPHTGVGDPTVTPMPTAATPGTGTIPSQAIPQSPYANAGGIPTNNSTQPIGATNINPEDYKSVYGDDTGNAITQLLNSEGGGTASTTAQQIIQANAPNVAQGSAQLNEGLAASGISPSSSVSAIENANYMAQVQQGNLKTEAETSLAEQQMQQQLLESLLPSQQQRQTDSSGWSIFGDVLSGIGSIFGL